MVKLRRLASRASLVTTSKVKSERQESAILLPEAVIRSQDTTKETITNDVLIQTSAAKMVCNLRFQ